MKRCLVVLTALSLLLLVVLPACGGGGGEETPTANPTITAIPTNIPTGTVGPTATPTAVATATTTPTSSEPVKIGAINSWSGAAAISGLSLADPVIKLVEKQVKDQGGILGGRAVKVIRYDNRASTAEAQAGVIKLYTDDKVSAITMGGVSGAEFIAVADACEKEQILYSAMAHVEDLAKYKFTVNATIQREVGRAATIKLVTEVLKPKTAAFFGTDDSTAHSNMTYISQALAETGTKTVYMEYCSIDTTDFSPYLTRIKYEKPDFLYLYSGSNEVNMSVAKQIMELGGWGDIKVYTQSAGEAAKKMPGAQGWYMYLYWAPQSDNPASLKFVNEYQAMSGRAPSASQALYYNSLWTAIYAVELAGTDTDRVAIAQAARSGKLEWDTPMGRAHFMPDGTSGLDVVIEQIVDGAMVIVPMPQ
jgi:ABC-type branched-subunit amino acid transport system substrate-binding protein